ncbi:MAG: hypothetical protein ACK5JD_16160 [Mangrovibacterium sp.]
MAKEKITKAQLTGRVAGAVVFVLTSYGVQQLFFKKDMEKELKKVVLEVNKNVPMAVDEYTQLDSASSIGKANLTYYFSLFDLDKSEVNLDTVNKYLRPSIIENVKNNPDVKILRDNNITLDYLYYDKNGVFVLEISVGPDLYRN